MDTNSEEYSITKYITDKHWFKPGIMALTPSRKNTKKKKSHFDEVLKHPNSTYEVFRARS